jgi:hypothetical protein
MAKANYINHEFIILDASGSMQRHSGNVVKVTDALISSLAGQARDFPDQETRITVYSFSTFSPGGCECLIWDKDVLRVPSIAGLYKAMGGTPLCDAVTKVIGDIREIPVKYGDHTVLGYVVTDGGEGGEHSRSSSRIALPSLVRSLPDTWTLAALVPGVFAKRQLTGYGFAPGNIEIWDPSRQDAVEEVGERIQATSVAYASARSSGMRSTTSLFSMAAPSKADLKASLVPMTPGSYWFEDVDADIRIDDFVSGKTGKPYVPGKAFYQMTKRERIQHYKQVAVAIPDHKTKEVGVYVGAGARKMLGLPDNSEVRVSPGHWKDYRVFIVSTSMNRKLIGGTRLLIMR